MAEQEQQTGLAFETVAIHAGLGIRTDRRCEIVRAVGSRLEVPDNLVRLSVGTGHASDMVRDVGAAPEAGTS